MARPKQRFVPISLLALFSLTACLLTSCDKPEPSQKIRVTPTTFDHLPGWGSDDLVTFTQAFNRSCKRINRKPSTAAFGTIKEAGNYERWQKICTEFSDLTHLNSNVLRVFFESHFIPYQISAGDESEGLFTGYYEAALKGSRSPGPVYNVPLHKRPSDLVMVQLGDFRDGLKGQRIAGRIVNGYLKPYENREQIVAADWVHKDQALVWVDDPVDAFFVQIQGSGLVELDDGSLMRVGYDGHNGHVYYAIGRELIKQGELTKESVSMQSIRQWLEQHPDRADAVMNTNQSYIFFREVNGDGPVGGEGIALTAERSLAIDKTQLPYGLPLWVDIAPPLEKHPPIRRLMIAQDTGGAIRGPVRGDVFWGYGDKAGEMAGHMKSKGRYWALLPRSVQITASQ